MIGRPDIAKWRKIKGMSQKELSEKANINQSYLSALERHHKSPTLKVYFRICTALEICPHRVMNYDFYCPDDCSTNCIRE